MSFAQVEFHKMFGDIMVTSIGIHRNQVDLNTVSALRSARAEVKAGRSMDQGIGFSGKLEENIWENHFFFNDPPCFFFRRFFKEDLEWNHLILRSVF